MRQAVQRAAAYPMAARAAHENGRAQVAFMLHGGVVSGVSLVHSSGFPLLDQAALAAVRNARYPQPPPPLAGVDTRFVVWVQFRVPDDED